MKTISEFFRNLNEAFMETAMAEMGITSAEPEKAGQRNVWEFVERSFMEAAYAEAGEELEFRPGRGHVEKGIKGLFMPDDCQFGDNESCRMEA